MEHTMGDIFEMIFLFGGIALVILAGSKARIDKMKAERQIWQQSVLPHGDNLATELRALKEQVSEMQNTSHQFDISFDSALSRLEERVSRVETKVAAIPKAPLQGEDVQHAGLR